MIKPVYTIPEIAPMKFYRFLTKFGLPVSIFISIINLITDFSNHTPHWLDGSIMIAHIILLFFSIDGLRDMKWSGVRFLYANILVSLGYNSFFLLVYLVLDLPNLPSEVVSGTISNSVIFLMYFVYFSKRRLLFSPVPPNTECFTTKEICEDETPAEIGEAPVSPPELEPADAPESIPATPSPNKGRISLSIPLCVLAISAICISSVAIGYFSYSTGYNSGYDNGSESGYEAGHKAGYDEGHNEGYADAESAYSKTIADLQDRADTYQDLFFETTDEWLFFHNYSVIVTTTGSKYHHYGCPHLDDHRYYIYNIELAESKGYSPCLDCWDE